MVVGALLLCKNDCSNRRMGMLWFPFFAGQECLPIAKTFREKDKGKDKEPLERVEHCKENLESFLETRNRESENKEEPCETKEE